MVMTPMSATKVPMPTNVAMSSVNTSPRVLPNLEALDLMGMRIHGDDAHVGHEGAHAHKRRFVQREHPPPPPLF